VTSAAGVAAGPKRRGRQWLVHAGLALGSLAVALLGIEGALRVWPTLLGPDYANGVLSKYSARQGGIYYKDRALNILFMIPNHTARMYYNGHVWTHQSDALGFRNRRLAFPADIVLLGDSLIYGHGVDFEGTVGHALEQLTGLRVANLARQGDATYQQAYLLTEYASVFRPRFVFYAFYENDVSDLAALVTREAMEAFVLQPTADMRFPPRLETSQALRERQREIERRGAWRRFGERSYVYKAWRFARWKARRARAPSGPGEADRFDHRSLEWRYTAKAIDYMRQVAARHGAELVVAPIVPSDGRYREALRAAIAELELPFLDTSALTWADDPSLWLPNDGHFSPAGARRYAEILADHVRQRLTDSGADARRSALASTPPAP
jgi:hypothetical protein